MSGLIPPNFRIYPFQKPVEDKGVIEEDELFFTFIAVWTDTFAKAKIKYVIGFSAFSTGDTTVQPSSQSIEHQSSPFCGSTLNHFE